MGASWNVLSWGSSSVVSGEEPGVAVVLRDYEWLVSGEAATWLTAVREDRSGRDAEVAVAIAEGVVGGAGELVVEQGSCGSGHARSSRWASGCFLPARDWSKLPTRRWHSTRQGGLRPAGCGVIYAVGSAVICWRWASAAPRGESSSILSRHSLRPAPTRQQLDLKTSAVSWSMTPLVRRSRK